MNTRRGFEHVPGQRKQGLLDLGTGGEFPEGSSPAALASCSQLIGDRMPDSPSVLFLERFRGLWLGEGLLACFSELKRNT